jgi:hypothetical protein
VQSLQQHRKNPTNQKRRNVALHPIDSHDTQFIPLCRNNTLLGPTIFHLLPRWQADIALFLLKKAAHAASAESAKAKPANYRKLRIELNVDYQETAHPPPGGGERESEKEKSQRDQAERK